MSRFNSRIRRLPRHSKTGRKANVPSLEGLEPRLLLSNSFLQGTAFFDTNLNGQLDAADTYKSGATILLYDQAGNLVDQKLTDGQGGYEFDNVAPGVYRLVEPPQNGYVGSDVQIMSPLNPAVKIDAHTIQVTVLDPSSMTVTMDENAFFAHGYQAMLYAVDGFTAPGLRTLGQFPMSLTSPALGAAVPFFSFCTDLYNEFGYNVQTYPVNPGTDPLSPTPKHNAGRIAYLYNHYGRSDIPKANKDTAVALQLAMWELEFDDVPDAPGNYVPNLTDGAGNPMSGNFYYVSGGTNMTAVLNQANAFLNDSVGKSEQAVFLNTLNFANPFVETRRQGVIISGSLNFANVPAASLGDFVWEDANANGIQDAGEAGIAQVPVNLLAGSTVVASQLTDGAGGYLFTGLAAGTYQVEFGKPAGYQFTFPDVGSDSADSDAAVATGLTGPVTLSAGQVDLTVDAGLYRPAALGDFVWLDANANGIQDAGETGIANVPVALTGTDGAGNAVSLSTGTNGIGLYLFDNLVPGTYAVSFTAPSDMVFSPALQGSDPALDSNADAAGNAAPVMLASGQTDLTVDAGLIPGLYYRPARLGDYVWEDANRNGIQDAGEIGIANVPVSLSGTDRNGDPVSRFTTTNSFGLYLFANLVPGTYSVTFTAPGGMVFTAAIQGADRAVDSNADAGGNAAAVTLAPDQSDLTIDAGLYRPVAPVIDIEKYVKELEHQCGWQGLTPGFWKQDQHFEFWTHYQTGERFNSVFGVNDQANLTLLGALQLGGGGSAALGRQAVAALLNSLNTSIHFAFSPGEVIEMVRQAYATGAFEATKNVLEEQNSLENVDLKCGSSGSTGWDWGDWSGCGGWDWGDWDWGNWGGCGGWDWTNCGGGGTGDLGQDADTPPGLRVDAGDSLCFTYIVTNPGPVALQNIIVTDDNETPTNPADDFNPLPVLAAGHNIGDVDGDSVLDVGERWVYTATKKATTGQHQNIGTVTGTAADGTMATDSDAANWTTGCTPQLSYLSGYVYLDGNNNGVFDSSERGIGGVSVALTGTDAQGRTVNVTKTTQDDGSYVFFGLAASGPGGYTISESQPGGYLDGLDSVGSLGGTLGPDQVGSIPTPAGANGVKYNFGELLPPPGRGGLSGMVWQDDNDNGLVDFGEVGISCVPVRLTGRDYLGQSVNILTQTDDDGEYIFQGLRPGRYTITETQPSRYVDGIDVVGTLGAVSVANDAFTVDLLDSEEGFNYNFGELLSGCAVKCGQTATIGFWKNKNGQALLLSLNGGCNATALGNWLGQTFPNLYGANAGSMNLIGKKNSEIAAIYQRLFSVTGQKLDAQMLALAFSLYVTDSTLAGTAGVKYGFRVTTTGVATATYSVGTSGAAFGVSNYTRLTVIQIAQAVDDRSVLGVLYSGATALRNLANTVLDGINNAGDIG